MRNASDAGVSVNNIFGHQHLNTVDGILFAQHYWYLLSRAFAFVQPSSILFAQALICTHQLAFINSKRAPKAHKIQAIWINYTFITAVAAASQSALAINYNLIDTSCGLHPIDQLTVESTELVGSCKLINVHVHVYAEWPTHRILHAQMRGLIKISTNRLIYRKYFEYCDCQNTQSHR